MAEEEDLGDLLKDLNEMEERHKKEGEPQANSVSIDLSAPSSTSLCFFCRPFSTSGLWL